MEDVVVDGRFWRRKRVVVTGHTGFKGSWLSVWLADLGADVVGFSNDVPTQPSLYEDAHICDCLSSVTGDIRDGGALRRTVVEREPDIVFHLAAQSLVRRSYKEPVETYETNVVGTANVLEAACGVARVVVVATSDKCYTPSAAGRPHRESDPLGGRDPYSSSKACAELVVAAYRASFAGDSVIATVRAGNVIGGGDWAEGRLLPDLVRGALSGTVVSIRHPNAVRPWQHVLNPVEGYLLLAQAMWQDGSHADGWNFGPDAEDERSVAFVTERLSELWPTEIRTQTGASDAREPETEILRVDSSKARERLGWRPRWDLDEALRSVAEWTRGYEAGDDLHEAMLDQIHAHQAIAVRT